MALAACRVIGATAVPLGAELWVTGHPEPMPRALRSATPSPHARWEAPRHPDDQLLRTHLVISGAPLYCHLSVLELLADGRDEVAPVEAVTVRGFR